MKDGQVLNILAVVAVVATAAGSWYFREPLGHTLGRSIVETAAQKGRLLPDAGEGKEQVAAAPSSAPQTVYRWVDADGITHYDQTGGAGREAVVLDPSKIQRLEDLTPQSPAQPQP